MIGSGLRAYRFRAAETFAMAQALHTKVKPAAKRGGNTLEARPGLKQPIFVVVLSLCFLVATTTACQYSHDANPDNSQRQLEHEHDELVQTIATKKLSSKLSDEELRGYDHAISRLERIRLQLTGKSSAEREEKLQASENVIKEARKNLAAIRAEKAKFMSGHEAVLLWQNVNDRVQEIISEIETLTEPDEQATTDQLNAYLKRLEQVRSQLAEQATIIEQHPELFTEKSKLKEQAAKIVASVDGARKVVSQRLLKDML
jgi:molecular chaperone DnaK (HSP70)